MEYKILDRKTSVCLECGTKIRYGRTDKKFCCDSCRMKHFNLQKKQTKAYKRRVINYLLRNYDILDSLLLSDRTSVEMVDLIGLGFIPGVITAFNKSYSHNEYSCFDIKYRMTASKIYGIRKISLNL